MTVIDEYLATVTPDQKQAFEHICRVARQTVSPLEDGTSYGVSALLYQGRPVIGFAVAKKYLSVYPFSGKVIDQLREDLRDYQLTSGSIHFSVEHPLTDAILIKIIQARLKEIEDKNN